MRRRAQRPVNTFLSSSIAESYDTNVVICGSPILAIACKCKDLKAIESKIERTLKPCMIESICEVLYGLVLNPVAVVVAISFRPWYIRSSLDASVVMAVPSAAVAASDDLRSRFPFSRLLLSFTPGGVMKIFPTMELSGSAPEIWRDQNLGF